jgi:hypothetical protein
VPDKAPQPSSTPYYVLAILLGAVTGYVNVRIEDLMLTVVMVTAFAMFLVNGAEAQPRRNSRSHSGGAARQRRSLRRRGFQVPLNQRRFARGQSGGLGGIYFENRIKIRQAQHALHSRMQTAKPDRSARSLCPETEHSQRTQPAAIDAFDSREIQNDVPVVRKQVADRASQDSGLLAINQAALAVQNEGLADFTSFHVETKLAAGLGGRKHISPRIFGQMIVLVHTEEVNEGTLPLDCSFVKIP